MGWSKLDDKFVDKFLDGWYILFIILFDIISLKIKDIYDLDLFCVVDYKICFYKIWMQYITIIVIIWRKYGITHYYKVNCSKLIMSCSSLITVLGVAIYMITFCRAIPVYVYRQTSNISRTWVGNKIADHSVVVGTSPVGAAPTTSSFSTKHLALMDWSKTTARRDENHLSFGIWGVLYYRIYGLYLTSILPGSCLIGPLQLNAEVLSRHSSDALM